MALLRFFNSPRVTLALTAFAYFLFLVLRLAKHDYDPSFFITAGDQHANRREVPGNLTVLPDSAGYDGQFYYRLALDPFTSKQTDFGITLDVPEYRQARILYPLLVWFLALGRPAFIPVIMLALNYAALCVLGWLGGTLAQTLNRNALWGLLFSLYAGFLLVLSRDLVEILQITFLLSALLLLRRDQPRAAALTLTLGTFIKETTLVAVAAILLVWLTAAWQRKTTARRDWQWFLIPFGAYLAWLLILTWVWGTFPLASGGTRFGTPLAGIVPFVASLWPPAGSLQRLWLVDLLFLSAFTAAVLIGPRSSRSLPAEKLSWFIYGGLALLWTNLIWVEDWAFLRQLSEFYLFGVILLLGSRTRLLPFIGGAALLLWLYVFQEILRVF